jgi:hypothetical protein
MTILQMAVRLLADLTIKAGESRSIRRTRLPGSAYLPRTTRLARTS